MGSEQTDKDARIRDLDEQIQMAEEAQKITAATASHDKKRIAALNQELETERRLRTHWDREGYLRLEKRVEDLTRTQSRFLPALLETNNGLAGKISGILKRLEALESNRTRKYSKSEPPPPWPTTFQAHEKEVVRGDCDYCKHGRVRPTLPHCGPCVHLNPQASQDNWEYEDWSEPSPGQENGFERGFLKGFAFCQKTGSMAGAVEGYEKAFERIERMLQSTKDDAPEPQDAEEAPEDSDGWRPGYGCPECAASKCVPRGLPPCDECDRFSVKATVQKPSHWKPKK